jgi:uncharacterized protein YkwD
VSAIKAFFHRGLPAWLLALLCVTGATAQEGVHDTQLAPAEVQQRLMELYGDPADEISAAQAAEQLQQLVNGARAEQDAPPLVWSEEAAHLAQAQAESITKARLGSHYDSAGHKPAQRWNLQGGTDNLEENMVYYEVIRPVVLTPRLVRHMFDDWLESDSHRANLLDPLHTGTGCAFSVVQSGGGGYVAGVQEFVRDYGSYSALPPRAPAGGVLRLSGLLDSEKVELAYIGLGREPLARPLSREQALRHGWTYSTPPVVRSLTAGQAGYSTINGAFATQLRLPPGWEHCAVYVTTWVRPAGSRQEPPFCAMTQVVDVP